jgi:hypothetical protein
MKAPQKPEPAQLPQPAQPVAPGPPATPGPQGPNIFTTRQVSDPEAVLRAARAQREELADQLDRLEEKRRELVQEIRQAPDGQSRSGIERRISEIDNRITAVEQELAAAELQVAKAAAVPGAVVDRPDPPEDPNEGRNEMIGMVSGLLIVFVLFPITIAYARRLWRRGAVAVSELPKVIGERLTRLDQAIDAIAIEVERISEGQRFLTKVMAESGGRALGTGPAQPIEIESREAARVPRG